VTLAVIQVEFSHIASNGEIVLCRSELTRRFANHGKRGDRTVDHLYGHVMPYLIQRGQARALPKIGKKEQWAFPSE
jgi:hypothetical protein